jgi:hypothetical protein
MFIDYLPKMNYPVRVGEHTNLAFALRLAWDYAVQVKDDSLRQCVLRTAIRFYKKDVNYPMSWEPGGNDFLSPALEEADLMWRILPEAAYQKLAAEISAVDSQPGFPFGTGKSQ